MPFAIALWWVLAMGLGCAPTSSSLDLAPDTLRTEQRALTSMALLFPADLDDGFLLCVQAPGVENADLPPFCWTIGELRKQAFGKQKWAD